MSDPDAAKQQVILDAFRRAMRELDAVEATLQSPWASPERDQGFMEEARKWAELVHRRAGRLVRAFDPT